MLERIDRNILWIIVIIGSFLGLSISYIERNFGVIIPKVIQMCVLTISIIVVIVALILLIIKTSNK